MNRLCKIRRAYGGISLRVLAECLRKEGHVVSWTHLNHYEKGMTQLSENKCKALANFFKVSPEYLNGVIPPQNKQEKIVEGMIIIQDNMEKKVDSIYDR